MSVPLGQGARSARDPASRPSVVVVAEAAPMRGGIATFAETITADPRLQADFAVELLNTARVSTRQGGAFNLDNVRFALVDAWRVFRAARRAAIVHLQLVADPGLPSLRAAALLLAGSAGRAALIAHVHSAVGNSGRPEFADYSVLDRFVLRALRRAQLVCTVSEAGTRALRAFAGSVDVQTVDNAVDVAAFPLASGGAPTSIRSVSRECPTVLFVGVICRRKGTVELARAGRLLRDRGIIDWQLVVVGGQGPTAADEYAEIVAEFDAAGLGDCLVGAEYGDQIKVRLQDADVFVLPSYLEGQPIAILEALASGLPVVATSVGAVPDVITDGIEGRVVEPGDVDALADALQDLITDRALRRRMSVAARARAESAHSLDHLSARLAGLYRDLLSVTVPTRRSVAVAAAGGPTLDTDLPDVNADKDSA